MQALFLALLVVLFLLTRYSSPGWLAGLFFRIDPLILLVTGIAQRVLLVGLLPGLAVVVGTLVFGRYFCGWVCPLGTMVDVADSVIPHRRQAISIPNGKYVVLLFLVSSAILRASFLHFFDPLVIMERTLALVAYPSVGYLGGWLGSIRPAAFTETVIAAGTFVLILGLGYFGTRFWCRNLCPLAGLLALFSKLAPFRFRFTEAECRDCGLCDKACPTGAIDSSQSKLDPGECIACFACRYECPDAGIRYGRDPKPAPIDIGRRQALAAIGSALVAAPLARAFVHPKLSGRLIRPPGSIPEPEFLNRCLHCGMCMKVCPTNGLQPCLFEAGLNGLWTPKLVPRIGGCEKNCNMCGQVCPTSAIRRLGLEEKTFARMGTAVVDRRRCIAWEQDKSCLICDEACPFDAITIAGVPGEQVNGPVVDEEICVGCGLCEARCPIEGPSAIQVWSIGEERKRTGSYITAQKRSRRECGSQKTEELPSGFILDDN
ncbi:MAG: 4Fe-4S binding protein [candidate division WOR-3 bacterium]|nr:MAG: 4Fe-4S binding protein [candidate division WOR-3 bacterium]